MIQLSNGGIYLVHGKNLIPENEVKKVESILGRIGRPEDLAPAIEFLLSELSLWQTGDIILVDGGKSI